jgi:hypothetical protein
MPIGSFLRGMPKSPFLHGYKFCHADITGIFYRLLIASMRRRAGVFQSRQPNDALLIGMGTKYGGIDILSAVLRTLVLISAIMVRLVEDSRTEPATKKAACFR